MGIASDGGTFGGGCAYTRAMLKNDPALPATHTLLKWVATWLTA